MRPVKSYCHFKMKILVRLLPDGNVLLRWDRYVTRVSSLWTQSLPGTGGMLLTHRLGPRWWSGLVLGAMATWAVTPALSFRLKQPRLCCRAGRDRQCRAWPSCWAWWESECLDTALVNLRCTANHPVTSLNDGPGGRNTCTRTKAG